MLEIEWILSFLLLGSVVGVMAGLLGIGGGGIMVPMLTSIFLAQGVPVDKVVHLALGTSMASIIFTSISSMRAHHTNGAVNWTIVKVMGVGVVLGTFLSTFIAAQINALYLAIFFSVFMAYVSIQMFLNKKPQADKGVTGNKELYVVGSGIGAISALVSIGGGSLTVPYLIWKNIDIKKAVGTSAAIGLPISIAGTFGYLVNGWSNTSLDNYTLGFVYVPAVLLISITSFFCAPYGVKLAHYLPVPVLKKVFALLLITLSIKMLITIV
ncbi:sulfite exporter TauE/SafE family protein [Algibacillus agarilyticus]|uniref:sulfite exporter TauE/SafE family protein n=1 Tax=Algibacillus agarilyticus TaxID=2234133 RepID=UPI0018E52AAA|nr:sulfite exporter TauE/SafE family protein [Algibacillus agarilyticus]